MSLVENIGPLIGVEVCGIAPPSGVALNGERARDRCIVITLRQGIRQVPLHAAVETPSELQRKRFIRRFANRLRREDRIEARIYAGGGIDDGGIDGTSVRE